MTDLVSCPFCDVKVTRPSFSKHLFSAKHQQHLKDGLLATPKTLSHANPITTREEALSYWMQKPDRLPYINSKNKLFNICFGCKHIYIGALASGEHSCKHHDQHLKNMHAFLAESKEEGQEAEQNISLASCQKIDELQKQLKEASETIMKLERSLKDSEKWRAVADKTVDLMEATSDLGDALLALPLFEGLTAEQAREMLQDEDYILKRVKVGEDIPAPPTERRVGPGFINRQDGMFVSQMKSGDADRVSEPVPEIKIWPSGPAHHLQTPPAAHHLQTPPLPSASPNAFPGTTILGTTLKKIPKKGATIPSGYSGHATYQN